MSMLQIERWRYDPKRGLARDTKDPQQSDQPHPSHRASTDRGARLGKIF